MLTTTCVTSLPPLPEQSKLARNLLVMNDLCASADILFCKLSPNVCQVDFFFLSVHWTYFSDLVPEKANQTLNIETKVSDSDWRVRISTFSFYTQLSIILHLFLCTCCICWASPESALGHRVILWHGFIFSKQTQKVAEVWDVTQGPFSFCYQRAAEDWSEK